MRPAGSHFGCRQMRAEVSVTSWTPTAMHKPIKLYLKRIQQIRGYQRGDQLPLWPEEIRCAPNEFLRSALFNARCHCPYCRCNFTPARLECIPLAQPPRHIRSAKHGANTADNQNRRLAQLSPLSHAGRGLGLTSDLVIVL
jgi:hypothetical protein